MADMIQDQQSPVLANIVVIVGFLALFSTFVTDSPASWVVGILLIVSGAVWAGFAGGSGTPGGPSDDSAA